MKKVKKRAKLMITWLGGDCCKPSADLSIEKTIESLTKGVAIINMLGAIPRMEISMKICITRPVMDPLENISSISPAHELAADASMGISIKPSIDVRMKSNCLFFFIIIIFI